MRAPFLYRNGRSMLLFFSMELCYRAGCEIPSGENQRNGTQQQDTPGGQPVLNGCFWPVSAGRDRLLRAVSCLLAMIGFSRKQPHRDYGSRLANRKAKQCLAFHHRGRCLIAAILPPSQLRTALSKPSVLCGCRPLSQPPRRFLCSCTP